MESLRTEGSQNREQNQLTINFFKDGGNLSLKDSKNRTIKQILEEGGIKEDNKDYERLATQAVFKNNQFYFGEKNADTWLYWQKVFPPEKSN